MEPPSRMWEQDLAETRGLTHWHYTVSPADIEQAAETLGRRCIVLDGTDVEDREGFLELCAQAFALPEWFTMSWEALEECLADFDAGEGLIVVWSDWALFAESDPEEYATAVDVLTDTARRFGREGKPYAVLLLGDDLDDTDPLDLLDGDDDDGVDEFELLSTDPDQRDETESEG